jgi:hypothetical protein
MADLFTITPLNQLLQADLVALYLATNHHTACPSWFCPVKSLAWRVASIMAHGIPQATLLSLVSPGVHVVATNVPTLIHQAALGTNLIA